MKKDDKKLEKEFRSFFGVETSNKKIKKIVSWSSNLMKLYENSDSINMQRGDIWLVDFGENLGSEVGKVRPALVVQNNVGNKFSNTTLVIPISSKENKLPTHLKVLQSYLKNKSDIIQGTLLGEQVRVVSKKRFIKKVNFFNAKGMKRVDKITLKSFGIINTQKRSQYT